MPPMKWTNFFIPTTKETPAEATVPSHRLMLRAGLIRQVVAGAYTYLPLGYLPLRGQSGQSGDTIPITGVV
jgi:prolyl-tRNA synthetase